MSRRPPLLPRVTGLLLALCGSAGAAEDPSRCVAHSGPLQPLLVELYTSEGCSSCPPPTAGCPA